MSISDTPETDAEVCKYWESASDAGTDAVMKLADLARKLERENAALREALIIEQERSFYWRDLAARRWVQP